MPKLRPMIVSEAPSLDAWLYCITLVKTGASKVNDASCVPRSPATVICITELPTPAGEAHVSVVDETHATVRQLV